MTFLADAPTAIPTVRRRANNHVPMQVLRFGAVGVLNTALDVVVLNLLLWAFAAHTTEMVLFFNAIAYAVGAVNSFRWNKRWTFQQGGPATGGEVLRFGVTTLGGMALNDILLWAAGQALLPIMGQTALATNAAKVIAIGGTVLLSYAGMRAWVFAHGGDKPRITTPTESSGQATTTRQQRLALSKILAHHGIAIVLPAYNEEQAITATVAGVVSTLDAWDADFEVIVVDDGSTDRTGAQIALLARRDARVRHITHPTNQGYGAALATGFAAASKDLTFFMDADGQFVIGDLALLLSHIETVDAALGYRRQRRDSWLRRFNAWGWNALVALLLGVRVRDLDCAFKLFHTDFLRAHPPTTQSALINAELLYRLVQSGGTYREVGVRHLPRQSGRATGANPLVIAHALGDLLVAAWRWRRPNNAARSSTTATANMRHIAGDMLSPLPQRFLSKQDIQIHQRGLVMLRTAQVSERWQALQARAKTTFSVEGATRFWQYLRVPHRLALLGITLISVILNFWQLGQNGYGNLYYAAAVKSMGSNWHAFFFVSLDTAGFVTVDKPPLGFWLQVVSTKIFGFTPFALFLPQALAGVSAVVLLYWLVRRHFGPIAGLIAALTLAVSPISVVTNRNNTIDSTLILALLLAAWATFRAVETDRLRWLIVAGVLIGLGFNIKMLEAYLVVPALALTYLLSSNKSWARRIVNLLITGGVMAAVSLAWVLAVDIIPASLRPWVGSTTNNSELTLAIGYNGLQRLTGSSGGSGGAPGGGAGGPPGGFGGGSGGPPSFAGNGNFTPPAFTGEGFANRGAAPTGGFGGAGGPGGAGGGQTGMFNTGNPGLFRLFTPPLGGQIVWMLPIALFGILALATQSQFRPREDRRQQSLILWGTWLVTTVVFFSVASFFHQYYLSQMTPAIAALAGIGIVTMWQQYRLPGWQGWLLPLALAVTAAEQVSIISSDPSWGSWLIPVIAIPTAMVALGLALVRWRPELNITRRMQTAAVGIGLLALLVAPTIWSAYPAVMNTTSNLPQVGVTSQGGFGGGADNAQVDAKLISYLEANQGSATYLVATASSSTADPIILATGKAVMALGGFTGSDPTLTTTQLQALVANGTVRYFLLNGNGTIASTTTANNGTTTETGQSTAEIGVAGGDGLGGAQSTATQWVQQNCTTVATSAYESTSPSTQGGFGGAQQLYDCKASTA